MSKTHDNPTSDGHTYLANITVHTEPGDFREMRDWLAKHARPVPRRDDHVLAKFIRSTLLSNAEWDGVYIDINVSRCRPAAPWDADIEPVAASPFPDQFIRLFKWVCLLITLVACAELVGDLSRVLDWAGAHLHGWHIRTDTSPGHIGNDAAA